MSDNVSLLATKQDGTKVSITALLTGLSITEIAPLPPPPPPSLEPIIPASAVTIDMLPKKWAMNHDGGTPGTAVGTSVYPFIAADGSTVRRNTFTLGGKGGEIYHAQVLADSSMYNSFCYELVIAAIAANGGFSNVQNIETDFEHVYADGSYVDLAMQLASGSGSVEVTEGGHWVATKVPAKPILWLPTILHTIRHYTRDLGDGRVTYIGSSIDSVYDTIGITVGDKRPGPWSPKDLNCQLQFDGASSGLVTSVVDIHALKAHCWWTANPLLVDGVERSTERWGTI